MYVQFWRFCTVVLHVITPPKSLVVQELLGYGEREGGREEGLGRKNGG